MKLTCRALRRLELICGNIAKTLNPARSYRVVSGLVQRWVSCVKFKATPKEVISFFGSLAAVDQAATIKQMEDLMFDNDLPQCKREAVMLFFLSKHEFIDSFKPSAPVDVKQSTND